MNLRFAVDRNCLHIPLLMAGSQSDRDQSNDILMSDIPLYSIGWSSSVTFCPLSAIFWDIPWAAGSLRLHHDPPTPFQLGRSELVDLNCLILFTLIPTLALVLSLTPSSAQPILPEIPQETQDQITDGHYTRAQQSLRELADSTEFSESQRQGILYEIERLDRVRLDFTLTPERMLEQLREDIPDATEEDMMRWKQEGVLEGREIDGNLLFFNRARVNLFRMSTEARDRRRILPETTVAVSDREIRIEDHMAQIIEARKTADSRFVMPQRYQIRYTLTVKPDEVPAGETVRCWLLYPRERANQTDIKWLDSFPKDARIAPNEALQRTVYLEQKAVAGEPVVFWIEYEITVTAQYEPIDPAIILPYDKDSELYRTHTAERIPHLEFTPELRSLAAEIVGDEENPYLKAKRIFEWIDQNITYTSALEYSTIPNISQYCAVNRRGDCGIQALLFIVLCRISGIPAHWQSGWSLLPGRAGMHDWAEFYVEPYGWLPADPSRGLRPVEDPQVRWFNFGNMDQFRLIGNDDYGMELIPPKKHFRSEPVDFQRGEVEWDGGNLYFNQWNYSIQVRYL